MPKYKFLAPEITDIRTESRRRIRKKRGFLFILIAITFLGAGVLIFLLRHNIIYVSDNIIGLILALPLASPIIALFIYDNWMTKATHKVREEFWKDFAEMNGLKYSRSSKAKDYLYFVMFRRGRFHAISHIISGFIENKPFWIFNYSFTTANWPIYEKTYQYTVFKFTFNGNFPHLFLDNHADNKYNFSVLFGSDGVRVPLSKEFEKKFALYAPPKYEIEALQIFTPDILYYLLDLKFKHDIEFKDQKVLIFADHYINGAKDLEKELGIALEIRDILEEKLDKITFAPIGNLSHTL